MQAISDAEADEKMADQLSALERSMSQDSAQVKTTDSATHEADKEDDPAEAGQKVCPTVGQNGRYTCTGAVCCSQMCPDASLFAALFLISL